MIKQEVKVFNKTGGYVRTYNVVQHGENFLELAVDYAKKIGGSVDKPMDLGSILQRELNPEELKKLDESIKPKVEKEIEVKKSAKSESGKRG